MTAYPLVDVVTALRVHDIHMEMTRTYGRLMRSSILEAYPPEIDRKTLRKYQNKLLSDDAMELLQFIWKESEFVSEASLEAVGLTRAFQNEKLTAHGIAVRLARTPKDVSKINSLVRDVGFAGEAYGLVERVERHRTEVELRATTRLHDFMINLASENVSLLKIEDNQS